MTWFPGNHHPSDKATYDITVTVPEGLRAVSNGELKTATPPTAVRRTLAHRRTHGELCGHARDRPSTTSTAAHARTACRCTSPSIRPRRRRARKVLARIPEIMEWAEGNFGPYPFSSTGAIVDRGEDVGLRPGDPEPPRLPRRPRHRDSSSTNWPTSGSATRSPRRAGGTCGSTRASPPTPSGCGRRTTAATRPRRSSTPSTRATYDRRATARSGPSRPPSRPAPRDISDSPVYDRGAMVLHKIRQAVGRRHLLRHRPGLGATHRHGNADTADFTAYVEKTAPDKDFSDLEGLAVRDGSRAVSRRARQTPSERTRRGAPGSRRATAVRVATTRGCPRSGGAPAGGSSRCRAGAQDVRR